MPEIWFPNLGIEIDHLSRTAFTVFGQDIYWYGIFIGLGVILGVLLALHEAKRTGQNPDTYLDFIIYAMIIAIIGARLYYVITASIQKKYLPSGKAGLPSTAASSAVSSRPLFTAI